MLPLHLAFQEGFSGDTVIVQVNGAEVARKVNLTSSLATALAGTADVTVDKESGNVQVTVPTKNLSASADINFKKFPYLAISVVRNSIQLTPSPEPFYYM